MSDEFDRISRGGAQVGVGLATASPLRIVDGLATVFGLETNASIVQKAVAIEHEDFVFETLLRDKVRLDSFEQRMAALTWTVEEHQRRLGEQGAVPSDLAALLDASFKVWQSTADAKKRKLHRNALHNAFDPKQYEEGLTLRLFRIFEDLEYGEIFVLRTMQQRVAKLPRNEDGSYKSFPVDDRKAAVPLQPQNQQPESMTTDHIRRLTAHNLCVTHKVRMVLPNDPPNHDRKVELTMPTDLGGRMLAFLADMPEDREP